MKKLYQLAPTLPFCCILGATLPILPPPSSWTHCCSPKFPFTFAGAYLCSLGVCSRVQTSDRRRCSSSPWRQEHHKGVMETAEPKIKHESQACHTQDMRPGMHTHMLTHLHQLSHRVQLHYIGHGHHVGEHPPEPGSASMSWAGDLAQGLLQSTGCLQLWALEWLGPYCAHLIHTSLQQTILNWWWV